MVPSETKVPIAYLIGSIHHCKDRTHAFDASERAVLEVGHIPLNPVKEEPSKTGMSCDATENKLSQLWSEQKLEEYRQLMDLVWIKDIENVRKADYLVLHYEADDNSVGAPLEMTMASIIYLIGLAKKTCNEADKTYLSMAKHCLEKAGFYHKPIYWVCQGPISEVNTTLKWLVILGCDIRVFKTYKELSDHLGKEHGRFNQ